MLRYYNKIDQWCLQLDTLLRTVFGPPKTKGRTNPSHNHPETSLSDKARRHSAGLMRVNHTGEVCAQALYQGQALTARNKTTRDKLSHAAEEENDHLVWCQERIEALDSHTSYLNLFFYLGALSIGITAGLLGDRWSLGFLAETEKQVGAHLKRHFDQLPENDHKSRAVVQKMCEEEAAHEQTAHSLGAAALPTWVCQLMTVASKCMTKSTYWL